MPGIIDCAVLQQLAREDWLAPWTSRCREGLPRLRLHGYPLAGDGVEGLAGVEALCEACLPLRRYDVAILPVSYATLAWTRTALARMRHRDAATVPIVALVSGLQAPAVQDLLDLGVADFLRDDACLDDVRIRLEQLAARPAGELPARLQAPVPALPVLQEPSARPKPDEPFRVAKTRIVATFERDYITRALARNEGNIAMAARSAQKHRRAFWALMRKHRIEAAPYRAAASGAAVP